VRLAAIKRSMINHMRGKTSCAREIDSSSFGSIGNDANDLSVEISANDGVVNGGEVRAAAGEKDR
jgi:hypothetical protein